MFVEKEIERILMQHEIMSNNKVFFFLFLRSLFINE